MKLQAILGTSALLAAVTEAKSSACLYCKRMDEAAGWLQTYSFCNITDLCLEDRWNYINNECESGWRRGLNLDLEFCDPDEVTCEEFVSSPDEYGRYTNYTNK
jgi:hypothetical protein